MMTWIEQKDQPGGAAFVQANSEIYEVLVRRAEATARRRDAEAALRLAEQTARFAGAFHPGRFADGAIENIAFDLGCELGRETTGAASVRAPEGGDATRRQILHVASGVHAIGGHSRMLHHWVQSDVSSRHLVALVRQGASPIPRWLSEAIRQSGGELVVPKPGSGLRQKARWLRSIAGRRVDLVVLHHGGSDVVPTVAFATADCPPVVVLNHADHQFWLGSSVADLVVNLRAAGSEHTAERRFVSRNALLPVPLADPARVARSQARRELGMRDDLVALLSVGMARKYRPQGRHDFVGTANRILNLHPNAHVFVVGESAAGIAPWLRSTPHERLHFVGSVEDPSLYRAAADIYLESFPFGSQTALLEAALSGLPVVPAYAPLFKLLVANDDSVKDILVNPPDEHEYVERVQRLVQRPEERLALGNTLRNRLLLDHVGQGWLDRLGAVYRETDRLTHEPRRIPTSSCMTTDGDIGMGVWSAMVDASAASNRDDAAQEWLCHAAYAAKEAEEYAMARRYAWRTLWHDPHLWAAWRLLAVALLGRVGGVVRWLLRRRE
jgi:glycosyltransferase involved in cell wall biosynthesis